MHVCVVDPVIRAGEPQYTRPFKTSKLETRSPEPVTFDPERISAWLGQTHQLCSKAVQTEHDPQVYFALWEHTVWMLFLQPRNVVLGPVIREALLRFYIIHYCSKYFFSLKEVHAFIRSYFYLSNALNWTKVIVKTFIQIKL